MKRIALATCFALVALAAPASAADPIPGRFVKAYRLKNQPHRAYFQVESKRDAEFCNVELRGKTVSVSVDTDNNLSGIEHIFYVHPRNAKRAVRQARRHMPDVSPRISCVKES